jgi:DNA adenine methylase
MGKAGGDHRGSAAFAGGEAPALPIGRGGPPRPLLRYFGGKWRLAPRIVAHFPPHRIYVEPFGGGASVLLRKPRAYNETYNDLDGEVVNLFRVLRSKRAAELIRLVGLTPYSRDEYFAAFELSPDPVERARRTLVRSHFGHGTAGTRMDRRSGFRSDGRSACTNVAGEWGCFADALQAVVERLRGVSIEHCPALELVDRFDDPKALLYLDPPYLPETRSAKAKRGEGYHTYAVEMSAADHACMLDRINASRAMIVLSGYPSATYEAALQGWTRLSVKALAHRNAARTEVIWLNPTAAAATPQRGLL